MKVLTVNIYLRSSFSLKVNDFGKELMKSYRLMLLLRLHSNIKFVFNLVFEDSEENNMLYIIIRYTQSGFSLDLYSVYYLNCAKLLIEISA